VRATFRAARPDGLAGITGEEIANRFGDRIGGGFEPFLVGDGVEDDFRCSCGEESARAVPVAPTFTSGACRKSTFVRPNTTVRGSCCRISGSGRLLRDAGRASGRGNAAARFEGDRFVEDCAQAGEDRFDLGIRQLVDGTARVDRGA